MKNQFGKFLESAYSPMEYILILCKFENELRAIDSQIKYKFEVDEDIMNQIDEVYNSILHELIPVLGFECRRRSDAKKDSTGLVSLLYWRIAAIRKLKMHSIFSTSIIQGVLYGDIQGLATLDDKMNKKEYNYKNFTVLILDNEIVVLNSKKR